MPTGEVIVLRHSLEPHSDVERRRRELRGVKASGFEAEINLARGHGLSVGAELGQSQTAKPGNPHVEALEVR